MMRLGALWLMGAALGVGVSGGAMANAGDSSGSSYAPTFVHYSPYAGIESGLAPIPWISAAPRSTGIVGHLFYYDGLNVWKQQKRAGLHIYSGGESPDGRVSMKILWELRHGSAPGFLVQGTRLDRVGFFTQRLQGGGVQFLSIINVPKPGCWRLTLIAGKLRGRVMVIAVPGRPR
jgi:hypothetical protein